MEKRYLHIWLPYLLTDWLIIRKPQLKTQPLVFVTSTRGKVMITSANTLATDQGVFNGMPLADAKAIIPNIEVFDDEPNRIAKILKELGEWCIRFSPFVANNGNDGLILDSSGCSHLWGGEEQYLQHILQKLQSMGYHCKGAIADTIGAAWAFARYGDNNSIIETGKQHIALLLLPAMALRLDQLTVQKLQKLGLLQIKSFVNMPKSVLRRRFGAQLLLKIGQAFGTEEETIKPLVIIPPYEERLTCIEPIKTATGIEIAITKLLEALCNRLKSEGLGLRKALLKCYRVDGKMVQAEIGTTRSSVNVNHLFKLFALKIPSIAPALGIELFTLEAPITTPIDPFQEKLWEGKTGLQDQKLAELLDRLAGKIGSSTIRRYLPQAHYWPERAIKPALSLEDQPTENWKEHQLRPVQLLQKPEIVEVAAPIPDYPPMNFRYKDKLHLVTKADGPERIECEWWIESGEHRDYYIVEDEKGSRYWLFRAGHYSETGSKWFIHGFFA